jgi:hypothetical protein
VTTFIIYIWWIISVIIKLFPIISIIITWVWYRANTLVVLWAWSIFFFLFSVHKNPVEIGIWFISWIIMTMVMVWQETKVKT